MTESEIWEKLNSENLEGRVKFSMKAWRDYTPTPEQIEHGLQDSAWGVRFSFVRGFFIHYTPTQEQIDRALRDEDWLVRSFVKRELEYNERNSKEENWLNRHYIGRPVGINKSEERAAPPQAMLFDLKEFSPSSSSLKKQQDAMSGSCPDTKRLPTAKILCP